MLDKILNAIGKFAYRCRYFVLAFAVLLFAGAAVVQSYLKVSYSYTDYSEILETFPPEDTMVLVYDNFDEDKIPALVEKLSENEHVTSLQTYSTTLGMEMDSAALAELAGIDKSFIEILFYIRENGLETDGMTVREFVDFLTSDAVLGNEMFAGQIDKKSKAQLMQLKTIVDAAADGTAYDAETLAGMLDVDTMLVEAIFTLSAKSEMTVEEFVDIAVVLATVASDVVDPELVSGLKMIDGIIDAVKENELLSASELLTVFPIESEALNKNTIQLLYVMYYADGVDMSETTLSIYDFFCFIADEIVPNEVFSSFFDESMKEQITSAKQMMEDGKAQLVGKGFSRLILTLDYEMESDEMFAFYKDLEKELDEKFDGVYYLIGNSAMSNELSKTFELEYLVISIITAVAIFLVVYLTFKKFWISFILIAVIECAVFITMSTRVIAGEPMYFIALIIVQCILMGSMVDYGILFTNYYIEVRKDYEAKDALPEVLKRSIRAIAMSAVILILITFSCGMIMQGAVSSILQTICVGSTSALILVVFVLPSLLAIFDQSIVKQKKTKKNEKATA